MDLLEKTYTEKRKMLLFLFYRWGNGDENLSHALMKLVSNRINSS